MCAKSIVSRVVTYSESPYRFRTTADVPTDLYRATAFRANSRARALRDTAATVNIANEYPTHDSKSIISTDAKSDPIPIRTRAYCNNRLLRHRAILGWKLHNG